MVDKCNCNDISVVGITGELDSPKIRHRSGTLVKMIGMSSECVQL